MPIHCRLGCLLLTGLLLALPAGAGPWPSRLPTSEKPKQPRIVTVFTRDQRLFVAGHNLPVGEDLEVRLGDLQLDVLHGTDSLVVTKLPELPLDQEYELVIRHGVREASVRSSAATWGFVLPSQQR
ncbi:MAG: hypothetical protein JSV45_16385 [Chromatiales bacterium]|nr:MAG: hypothetical protein JSV45_16385 [Chromatiales bacterium]